MLNQQVIMHKSLGQSKSGILQVKVEESSHNTTVMELPPVSQNNRKEEAMTGRHKLHSKHHLQTEDSNLKH
jgi:hypothetical protein